MGKPTKPPTEPTSELRELYKMRNLPGYCSPPKEHQFKKGKSGNPRGRPKKHLMLPSTSPLADFRSLDRRIAEEKVTITKNGKKMQVTRIEAMALKRAQDAMGGDLKAMREFRADYEKSVAAEQAENDRIHNMLLLFIGDTTARRFWDLAEWQEDMIETMAERYDDLTHWRVQEALKKHRAAPKSLRRADGLIVVRTPPRPVKEEDEQAG